MRDGSVSGASARLKLRILPSDGRPYDHEVATGVVVVGRSSSSDLVLPDRFLSRRHTEFRREDEGWQVRDLGSHNGTLLNGRRLRQSMPIRPGDLLMLSSTGVKVLAVDGVHAEPETVEPSANGDGALRTLLRDVTTLLPRDPSQDPARAGDDVALRKYTDRLRLLNEVHDALGRSVALAELFELILDRVFAALRPEEAWILVKEGEDEALRAVAARGPGGLLPAPPESRNLADEVMGKRMAALVVDAETDERFAAAQSLLVSGIKSLLAAPLLAGTGVLGMIVLSSRAHVKLFAEDDLELLVSLASVAALRIHNVSLAEEAAERRRLEKELALARRIQERLLPDALPRVDGWRLHAHNVPSRGVSGDYYTVVLRQVDGAPRLSVMIADVSGKGMAASLLTASLEALCAGPIEQGEPPEAVCEQVSRRLYVRTPPEKYATAVVVDLDPASGRVRYCNAGHNPGLLVRRRGDVEHLGTSGPPLGLMPGLLFAGKDAQMEPGDLLVLYTDGITEATDPDDQEFGVERLEQICREVRHQVPATLAEAVGRRLDTFTRGVPYADDRTLVVLQRA